jgi:hypothetical protein
MDIVPQAAVVAVQETQLTFQATPEVPVVAVVARTLGVRASLDEIPALVTPRQQPQHKAMMVALVLEAVAILLVVVEAVLVVLVALGLYLLHSSPSAVLGVTAFPAASPERLSRTAAAVEAVVSSLVLAVVVSEARGVEVMGVEHPPLLLVQMVLEAEAEEAPTA